MKYVSKIYVGVLLSVLSVPSGLFGSVDVSSVRSYVQKMNINVVDKGTTLNKINQARKNSIQPYVNKIKEMKSWVGILKKSLSLPDQVTDANVIDETKKIIEEYNCLCSGFNKKDGNTLTSSVNQRIQDLESIINQLMDVVTQQKEENEKLNSIIKDASETYIDPDLVSILD